MCRLTLPLAIAFCCFATAPVSADEAPVEIRLDDSRWQSLPLGIERPRVGPDGRVWLRDARVYWRPELPQLKQHLAEQYVAETPRVRAADLVAFEPGGRVWFYSPLLRTVLAYDGERWVVHQIEDPKHGLVRRCLTRGGLIATDAHRFAGDAVWLCGARGIFRHDGEKMAYQLMADEAAGVPRKMLLSVHPSGEIAVAHPQRTSDLWIWREGKWTKHEFPKETAATAVEHSVPNSPAGLIRRDGKWVKRDPPASAALAGISCLVVESSGSVLYVDARQRLQRLLIQDDGGVQRVSTEAGTAALGDLSVSSVRAMYADARGRLFVAADVINDTKTAKPETEPSTPPDAPAGGVVIIELDGTSRAVRVDGLADAWHQRDTRFPLPILTKSGGQVWVPNRYSAEPSYLLDLDRQEIVDRLPHTRSGSVEAVDDRGRAYVLATGIGSPRASIMVYTPGGPRSPALEVATKEIGGKTVAVSDDGTIWTIDADERLICFDGDVWNAVGTEPVSRAAAIIPGTGGTALICVGNTALVCERSKIVARGDLFELLETEHARIVRHFGPDKPAAPTGSVQIVASRNGRIWCLTKYSLRLLARDRWHDATDALRAAGSRHGNVKILAPIGTGDQVYVSDLHLRHSSGRSFFGQLQGRRLQFTDAPHALSSLQSASFTLRGRNGALWIAGTRSHATGPCDTITGQEAIRVLNKGIDAKLFNCGHARLVDQAGNVWLGDIRGKPNDLVNLWRDGEIRQTLRIPAYSGGVLCSDRPGSVYALTATGVQHLEADAPDYREYRARQRYEISGLTTNVTQQAYSRHGHLVLSGFTNTPRRSYLLHLIELPPSD